MRFTQRFWRNLGLLWKDISVYDQHPRAGHKKQWCSAQELVEIYNSSLHWLVSALKKLFLLQWSILVPSTAFYLWRHGYLITCYNYLKNLVEPEEAKGSPEPYILQKIPVSVPFSTVLNKPETFVLIYNTCTLLLYKELKCFNFQFRQKLKLV